MSDNIYKLKINKPVVPVDTTFHKDPEDFTMEELEELDILNSVLSKNELYLQHDEKLRVLKNLGIESTYNEINQLSGVTDNVLELLNNKLNLTGGTLTGQLTANYGIITNGINPGAGTSWETKTVDGKSVKRLKLDNNYSLSVTDSTGSKFVMGPRDFYAVDNTGKPHSMFFQERNEGSVHFGLSTSGINLLSVDNDAQSVKINAPTLVTQPLTSDVSLQSPIIKSPRYEYNDTVIICNTQGVNASYDDTSDLTGNNIIISNSSCGVSIRTNGILRHFKNGQTYSILDTSFISKNNSSYTVSYQTSNITSNITSGKYYGVETDKNGKMFVYVPWTDNNTLNTTGSTASTSKLFLVGASTQATSATTYSNALCFISNNKLYSKSAPVLTTDTQSLPLSGILQIDTIKSIVATECCHIDAATSPIEFEITSRHCEFNITNSTTDIINLNFNIPLAYTINGITTNSFSKASSCIIKIYLDQRSTLNIRDINWYIDDAPSYTTPEFGNQFYTYGILMKIKYWEHSYNSYAPDAFKDQFLVDYPYWNTLYAGTTLKTEFSQYVPYGSVITIEYSAGLWYVSLELLF